MILIVGAAASGKKTFAQTLGYAQADIADAVLDSRPVLDNLQELLDHTSLDDEELLSKLLAHDVVICTEIGSGLVPVCAKDRAWRDRVGHMCMRLSAEADTVIRMVCGIPTVVKGELPCNL